MKKNPVSIKRGDYLIWKYESVSDYSKAISFSSSRIRDFLKGRTEITEEEHEQLIQMSFQPRNWDHMNGNKNKKNKLKSATQTRASGISHPHQSADYISH